MTPININVLATRVLLSLSFIAIILITFSTLVLTFQNQTGAITVRGIKSKCKKNTYFWRRRKAKSWYSFAWKSPNQIEKEEDQIDKTENKILVVLTYKTKADKLVEGLFFYKRKLTMYNLTASTSSKQCYCSIWTEIASGRADNDIVSSFISISWKGFW